ncbi:agamous-like MADS-box protein AGL31 [Syzygium oleosum]|uniref:agamous-like MADS-box protein AGL31 n=1 Tax=Syzygium oleosum TaxID=219896 RepID=UPI0011D297C3|nr:agamous-like MADS-box protein AGL31 [Syzygium oleosum]
MGRKKVVMKRIEDNSSRQVTFSKRRGGLMKKARELSVLCDVEVALLVFSSRGKQYVFCSGGNNSLAEILERYRNHSEEAEGSKDANEGCPSGESSLLSPSQLLQLVQRYVEGPDDDNVSVTDLVHLEEQLDAAIVQTRHRKTQLMTESVITLQDQERLLREENELLEREIASMTANDEPSNEAAIRHLGLEDNQSVDQSQQATLNFLQ